MRTASPSPESQPRAIIHLDLDAFFCAVEELRDPSLRGKPFAVGGRPEGRGVVSSCSYAARAYGVHSAMPMAQAVRLCPDLIVIRPHFQEYRLASSQVMAKLRQQTDLVEQISIDEAFLDVTSNPRPAREIAGALQADIRETLSLPCSLGIATNKLVAKIANDVGKAAAKSGTPPNALTIVPPGEEAAFLAPLPVEMLWGVGPKTAEKLAALGITTIGQLAQRHEVDMLRRFGQHGFDLVRRARGIDNRPLVTHHKAKSISQEVTFTKDCRSVDELRRTLRRQVEHIATRLVKNDLTARTVKIKIRWPDFTTLTRQTTLGKPTSEGDVIAAAAEELFKQVWSRGRAVRLIGVGVSGLEKPPRQIGLWDRDWEKEHRLQQAIAALRERFGEQALSRGLHPREET